MVVVEVTGFTESRVIYGITVLNTLEKLFSLSIASFVTHTELNERANIHVSF